MESGKCDTCGNGGNCGCGCHKGKGMMGIFIILIGLAFLLGNTGVLSMDALDIIWPIIVMLAGIKMLAKMCKCCGKAGH